MRGRHSGWRTGHPSRTVPVAGNTDACEQEARERLAERHLSLRSVGWAFVKQYPSPAQTAGFTLPLPDTTGDVGHAGDELDRQLDRSASVGLLLEALTGHVGVMAPSAMVQTPRCRTGCWRSFATAFGSRPTPASRQPVSAVVQTGASGLEGECASRSASGRVTSAIALAAALAPRRLGRCGPSGIMSRTLASAQSPSRRSLRAARPLRCYGCNTALGIGPSLGLCAARPSRCSSGGSAGATR